MKIAYTSDIHLEFFIDTPKPKTAKSQWQDFPFHVFENQNKDIDCLILAGDVVPLKLYRNQYVDKFWHFINGRFAKVIVIAGNHEFYKGEVLSEETYREFKKSLVPFKNIEFLQNESYALDEAGDVIVTGSTLWTSLNNSDPNVAWRIVQGMNDFVQIKNESGRLLNADNWLYEYKESLEFISKALERYQDKKHVVVTHHAPSKLSVSSIYNDPRNVMNFGYYSDLEDLILDHKPKAWIHGHMHHTKDYKIGDTYVALNAMGYYGREYGAWDKTYKLETFEV